jgi:hypothetical protein
LLWRANKLSVRAKALQIGCAITDELNRQDISGPAAGCGAHRCCSQPAFGFCLDPARNPKFLAFDNKTCLSPFAIARGAAPLAGTGGVVSAWFGRVRMRRDDLFFWLSVIWLVVLSGTAIWVFAA